MDLGDSLTAGELVQVIDILSDDVLEAAHLLHVAQGEVTGVGHRRFESLNELAEAVGALPAHLPPAFRVLDESLVIAEIGLAVLGPETLRPAASRDAAFGRQPGADQRPHMP